MKFKSKGARAPGYGKMTSGMSDCYNIPRAADSPAMFKCCTLCLLRLLDFLNEVPWLAAQWREYNVTTFDNNHRSDG
jgi:hypothetical protein